MVLLAGVPNEWQGLVSSIIHRYPGATLTWQNAAEAIIGEWKIRRNVSSNAPPPQQANKMSAVKRHKGSHEWKSNNQGNQQSSSNHQTNKGQFKKKHGGRGKEKAPANQQQQHVHITSSGIVADDIQTPWIPQIPVTQ
ncbi:hypothetical protein H0H81_010971, partial [Sphagnurus paluster]